MTLDLDTLVLRPGTHTSASDGVSLMEAVSALAGEPWSNSPSCTSPMIAAYARGRRALCGMPPLLPTFGGSRACSTGSLMTIDPTDKLLVQAVLSRPRRAKAGLEAARVATCG